MSTTLNKTTLKNHNERLSALVKTVEALPDIDVIIYSSKTPIIIND